MLHSPRVMHTKVDTHDLLGTRCHSPGGALSPSSGHVRMPATSPDVTVASSLLLERSMN